MTQQVKDPALLLWLMLCCGSGYCCGMGSIPGPRNFCTAQVQTTPPHKKSLKTKNWAVMIHVGWLFVTAFGIQRKSDALRICLTLFLSTPYFLISKLLLFFFCFISPQLWHMEVFRLGVESELKLLAYTTAPATMDPGCVWDLHHRSQQRWILTHWAKQVIEPATSRFWIRFVSAVPQWELLISKL